MAAHNVYREGKVHVAKKMCSTCIFRPHERPVPGARVAELVRGTKDEDGASVVCHHTLFGEGPRKNAVCRGWFDRLADRDPIFSLAKALGNIEEQEVE
jgi:hypothetical protein